MSILTRTLSPPDPTGTVLSDHPARLARYIQRARRAGCSGFIPAHAHLPEPVRLARRPVWHATHGGIYKSWGGGGGNTEHLGNWLGMGPFGGNQQIAINSPGSSSGWRIVAASPVFVDVTL